MTRATFPDTTGAKRGVIGVTTLLMAGAMVSAVLTS